MNGVKWQRRGGRLLEMTYLLKLEQHCGGTVEKKRREGECVQQLKGGCERGRKRRRLEGI